MGTRAFLVEVPDEVERRLRPALERRGVDAVAFRPVGFFSLCMRGGCCCAPVQRCADLIIYGCDFLEGDAFEVVEKQFSRNCRVNSVAIVSSNWTAPALSHAVSLGIRSFSNPVHMGKFDAWVRECLQEVPDGRVLAEWFRGAMTPEDLRLKLRASRSRAG